MVITILLYLYFILMISTLKHIFHNGIFNIFRKFSIHALLYVLTYSL